MKRTFLSIFSISIAVVFITLITYSVLTTDNGQVFSGYIPVHEETYIDSSHIDPTAIVKVVIPNTYAEDTIQIKIPKNQTIVGKRAYIFERNKNQECKDRLVYVRGRKFKDGRYFIEYVSLEKI